MHNNYSNSDLGQTILDHDGLMTPVLYQYFGDVIAKQIKFAETREIYTRDSEIRQSATGALILTAQLKVSKKHLPASLIDKLRGSTALFGQLLLDHQLEVEIHDRKINVSNQHSADLKSWGRTHNIVEAATGKLLCEVREALAPEILLNRLST